jgi:hypothetical protein
VPAEQGEDFVAACTLHLAQADELDQATEVDDEDGDQDMVLSRGGRRLLMQVMRSYGRM